MENLNDLLNDPDLREAFEDFLRQQEKSEHQRKREMRAEIRHEYLLGDKETEETEKDE